MIIRPYAPEDEDALFAMMEREGEEWGDYWSGAGRVNFRRALASSIVYVVCEGGVLCGFVRCRDDDGFGVYVYDLLVDLKFRGKGYGRQLMETACGRFPDATAYVMSDVDPYYRKLGYEVMGTVFKVRKS